MIPRRRGGKKPPFSSSVTPPARGATNDLRDRAVRPMHSARPKRIMLLASASSGAVRVAPLLGVVALPLLCGNGGAYDYEVVVSPAHESPCSRALWSSP